MTLKPRATNSAATGSRSPMLPLPRPNSTSTGVSGRPSNPHPYRSISSRVDLTVTEAHAMPVDAGFATYLSLGDTARASVAASPTSVVTTSNHTPAHTHPAPP